MELGRLVGTMLQISIIILFRISLKLSLHYAQFCSFYAYDFIIILHLQVNYYYIATFLKYSTQNLSSHSTSLSVSWSLTYSESLTFTASSTVSVIEMSLVCYFAHLFFR